MCISSIQQLNRSSIEFFLSTWTQRVVKSSQTKSLQILNKQWIRGKDKYLVQQKGFTVELDTWEEIENLENAKEAVEEFEKEYQWDIEDVRQQEREEEIFRREELLG